MAKEIDNGDKSKKEKGSYIDKISHLKALYDQHGNALSRDPQFLCYGILIALFHFGEDFFNCYKFWALSTAALSIFSLSLIYLYTLLTFLFSNSSLELHVAFSEDNEYCSESCMKHIIGVFYKKKRPWIMFVFWSFQVTLILSVGFFIRSAYLFFYE